MEEKVKKKKGKKKQKNSFPFFSLVEKRGIPVSFYIGSSRKGLHLGKEEGFLPIRLNSFFLSNLFLIKKRMSYRRLWIGSTGVMSLYFLQSNFFTLSSIQGPSMKPTLNPDTSPHGSNDIVLIRRPIQFPPQYKVGQVLVFRNPFNSDQCLVKRLVALEGEVVQMAHAKTPLTIPQGHGWLESDEPYLGTDSRHFGPVSLGLVEGEVCWIVWPWHRIGPLKPRIYPFKI